jgi:predicted TIM-barrel fold metal-dependent hydrolase
MLLENFRPQSCLTTKRTEILTPRFPVIDAHNHLGDEFGGGWIHRPVSELIDVLDQAGIIRYVDLDGGWGEDILIEHLEKFKAHRPDRFQVFGGVNWDKWIDLGDGFPDWAARRLEAQKKCGADGVKIWKNFGLKVRDQLGNIVAVDDERLEPVWLAAGELVLPVMIHVADPVAFFNPLDETNERWEELQAHPDWQFPSPAYPLFNSIVEGLSRLVNRYPGTIFIGAHVGCYAENLGWVADMLDRCPNFFVDISARIGELGRQPYSARKFFIKYADRILFGSDFGPDIEAYRLAYRFLETDDEYFNYNTSEVPMQGRWYVHGINLPDDVLKKVYHLNAEKVLVKIKWDE